jgi:hypothetical protein
LRGTTSPVTTSSTTITLYWLTGTGASAARSYWEAYGPDAPAANLKPRPPSTIPFAFTTFPGEIWRTPRSWVDTSYPNVIYFNEVDQGGPLRRVGRAGALLAGDPGCVSDHSAERTAALSKPS